MSSEPRQASLLRGINVGRANRIRMPVLRHIYESIGAHEVETYLNSGNLVFRHAQAPGAVSRLAESAITEQLGLEIVVIGRSKEDLARIAAVTLFEDAAANQRFVVFMDGPPKAGGVEALRQSATDREELRIVGNELHMHLRDGIGRSKLMLPLIERRLGARGTARNWTTATKLAELAAGELQA